MLVTVCALLLTAEPSADDYAEHFEIAQVEEDGWDPDRPVEAQRETEEARTTGRFSVSLGFGVLSDPGGAGPSTYPHLGPSLVLAKPFWMGTRRPYNQFLFEARVAAGFVPGHFALLTMSPMWGTNFYFGPYVGLELRLGFGFAAKLSAVSNFGVASQGEVGICLRVFKDDRTRLKLLAGAGTQLYFDNGGVSGLSAWLGAGFETAL